METCFDYTTREYGYFSSDEPKYIRKVRKLKEQYPEQVRIIREPEENNGCIYCTLPIEWFRIQVPKKMNYTDEQREEIARRFALSNFPRAKQNMASKTASISLNE